ncbi:hypothetical protein B9Z19DRAFT_1062540 [Tuber borchii]|uniref:Metal homeostatis protein bsd2 n=1 Tax=Tuber borchii TaxID=42251 RepID=A0A2T7A1D8_TUBBO|nr:hypothetical protein B9Z19DRAFT_1062540 [Tuber borchii]
MGPRYERIAAEDDGDLDIHGNIATNSSISGVSRPAVSPSVQIPSSPPPSFHSRSSTPDPDSALSESFDSPSDGEDDDMRNVRGSQNSNFNHESIPLVPTATTGPSVPASSVTTFAAMPGRAVGGGQTDGVFTNLSAKPTVEKLEEHPPSYEQAAADATPPYWETTILAPGMSSDEVFIDGLPVGSVFAFIWNAMISMSFTFVGFLLTYLLHTTHAAKNGSRAGLGITLIQYGFYMRSRPDDYTGGAPPPETEPSEPNSYDFGVADMVTDTPEDGIGRNEWISYALMVVGWFILIRSVSSFVRARRTEQVVLASPDRGLGTAVIADDEQPARAV